MMNLYARTGDTKIPYDLLVDIINKSTLPNLLNNKPPIQLDANMGATAGIAEMLLQSHAGDILLLPALPDQWIAGKIEGLQARGGFTVNIEWNDHKLTASEVISHCGNKCRLRYKDRHIDLDTKSGKSYKWLAK